MIHSDIIIIGAGAAGLMAAIAAPGSLVLEKMPRVARKMMITGKGRCNFTNVKPWQEFSTHIHPKANVVRSAFYSLPPEKVMEMLESAGLPCVVERGERAFPESHKAVDVVDTLVSLVKKAGSRITTDCGVTSIERSSDGFVLGTTKGLRYSCRKLIITCGGLSYPTTGSTGDGYRFAAELGHSVTKLYPSLTALVPVGYKAVNGALPRQAVKRVMLDSTEPAVHGSMNPVICEEEHISKDGIKHIHRNTPLGAVGQQYCGRSMKNVGLDLYIDGALVQSEFGDIDFTDGGLEGPIGYKVSRRAVRALENGSKVSVQINFKKDERPLKFDIAGYVGYERAVVTAGGVSTGDIVPKTMESRIVPGLYFAGEVLDIDADTGGYNLQLAFCTGHLAGLSAAK